VLRRGRWKRKQYEDLCKVRSGQHTQAKKETPDKIQRREKKALGQGLTCGVQAKVSSR